MTEKQAPPPQAEIGPLEIFGRAFGDGRFALYARTPAGEELPLEANGGPIVVNTSHPPDPGAQKSTGG